MGSNEGHGDPGPGGEKVFIRRRALDTVGGSPRQRMLDKPADAGKLAPSNRREQSHAKAISRICHDVAPGFCYSGLTPLFSKGNRLSGTLRGRVTKFGEPRNQTHIRLPRLNELHVSILCKTELGTQCPMEPYQHVSLSYFRLVVLESTLAI